MPPARRPRSRPQAAPDPYPITALAELGIDVGDPVRFRRRDTERWKDGTVVRREADGSLGVTDLKGAHRSVPIEMVEAKERGPRGGVVWVPLTERAARTEQMKLL